MYTCTSIRNNAVAVITLLLGAVAFANAAPYRIEEITKAEVGETTYTIYGGNQYLNSQGQVTGVSLKYQER